MFLQFLYELRARGVMVSTHEWIALSQALALGLHESSLDDFYHLARCLCVKDIGKYDAFDAAFLAVFRDVQGDALALSQALLDWLADPKTKKQLSDAERAALQRLNLEELRRLFEERLREQKERHDGGNRWIGTGGSSPFGSGGTHPTGIRVGPGGGRSAMAVAGERRFAEYRRDVVLDVRQIDVALRGLRQLGRDGAEEELDMDETIDETCRNAGDIEIVMRAPRRNRAKVLLLMDVGGSMDAHSELASRLFTAASRAGRFARMRSYYFHNCIYEAVYEDALFRKPVALDELLATTSRDEKVVIVGDALMHPAELLDAMGAWSMYGRAGRMPGLEALRRVARHFRKTAWLNPEPNQYWRGTTIEPIAEVFAMFPLTIDGLGEAVRHLVTASAAGGPNAAGGSAPTH
ncbi:MAG: VWA domain-containing protein [Myxococcales bacterium]|nr:VWA domain-containing protein [Myxococcales bacterium]